MTPNLVSFRYDKQRQVYTGRGSSCYMLHTDIGSLKCLNIGGPISHVSWMGVYTCIFLIKVFTCLIRVSGHCACMSAQLCPTLGDPTDCSPPDSSPMGFPKQESCSGLPFPSPGDLSDPGVEPTSLASSALALCYLGNPLKVLMSVFQLRGKGSLCAKDCPSNTTSSLLRTCGSGNYPKCKQVGKSCTWSFLLPFLSYF